MIKLTELETKKARVRELERVIMDARHAARVELDGMRWKYGEIIKKAKSEQMCLEAEISKAEGRSA